MQDQTNTTAAKRVRPVLSALAYTIAAVVVGCSGSSNLSGPCSQVIRVAEPVVQITAVTNKDTGAPITQFTLGNFTFEGSPFANVDALVRNVPSANATVVNGTLVCSGNCGFGYSPGAYTFTVSAVGRPDATVAVKAAYASSSGQGCSRVSTGGTTIKISM